MDIEIGCFIQPEVDHAETKLTGLAPTGPPVVSGVWSLPGKRTSALAQISHSGTAAATIVIKEGVAPANCAVAQHRDAAAITIDDAVAVQQCSAMRRARF